MSLHYLGKHEHEPRKFSFQSCCIPFLENNTALACYIFDTHQPTSIIFVDNKAVLLHVQRANIICRLVISFSGHGMQHDRKDTILEVHFSPDSAQTLVMRGGNHRLIAYSLSNISAKNN